jgi:Tfp pilus assembly protein PilW
MKTPTTWIAGRLRAQDGITLIELLIAMILGLVVAGGAMTFVIVALDQQNTISSRSVAQRQAEVGLARLTRELRQAQEVVSSTGANSTPVTVTFGGGSSSVTFYLPPAGGAYTAGTQVTWTCTAGSACTRTSGGVSQTEITGVTSATLVPTGGTTSGTASSGTACTSSSPCCTASNTSCVSTGTASGSGTDVCTSGAQCTTSSPGYLGISLSVQDISQSDSGATHSVRGISNPITLQDGVGLANY